jgi:ElaB/YqjD/DUF883 family membrane-anchored ribosome-binding protein
MTMTDLQQSPSITTLEDVQRDVGALRDDIFRLSREVSHYLTKTSRKALSDANQRLDDAVRDRPFVAVAIAAGLGLLFGAIFWRR